MNERRETDRNAILLVFVDMDGTILNTLEDLADSLNVTLEHFGYLTYH